VTVKKQNEIKLFDAIREITKDKNDITIAEREILKNELLMKILRDARKDKLVVGAELHDGSCIFFADKEDIYKFESKPYRTDITTEKLGSVQFQYEPAKLKIIERTYNIFDKKSMKWIDKDGKSIPKWHRPSFVQAESLNKIKTEKTIDGKYKYHKIYYDITINNFVIPRREWERYKENLEVDINFKQTFEGEEKTTLLDDLFKDIEYQSRDNVFIKKADYWIIAFEGKTIPLEVKGNVGLEYIARFLNNPNREYEAHKLRDMIENINPQDSRDAIKYAPTNKDGEKEDTEELPTDDARNKMDGVDVVLDSKAREEYEKELRELNEGLQRAKTNNDLGQKDEIQKDINLIKKQMSADYGLKGHPRMFGNINETARKAISNSVNRVYKKLEKEHEPIWKHFTNNITISHKCSYSPGESIDWNVRY
jgi:DNA-binding cell septation regulator SpoVG|tara:strand:- start:367 stop:1638 length:1272 start_codon:yes stop_codon:yes gene_type:complete